VGGHGDTFQAVRRHGFHDPLVEPGGADLTAHVDFASLGRAAAQAGAAVFGPVGQGALLEALGLSARAEALAAAAPDQAADIAAAAHRLAAPEEMGELFKALALAAPGAPPPPGFPEPAP
jgi:NADH dehydrogenase [ubiquinone] 1 alpha subcomplex assembly factor 7